MLLLLLSFRIGHFEVVGQGPNDAEGGEVFHDPRDDSCVGGIMFVGVGGDVGGVSVVSGC